MAADVVQRVAKFISDFNATSTQLSSGTGSLAQIWMPEAGDDGSIVLNTQGLPYSINGVGDLLALFRCISCKYKFATDVSKAQQMGAVGRVFTSGEPEMSHNVQRYDQQVYLRAAEAQRCRVHSTLFMPLYGSPRRDACLGVFEVVLTEPDVNFAGMVAWIKSCLQSESLYTADVDSASLQGEGLGMRSVGGNDYGFDGVSALESGAPRGAPVQRLANGRGGSDDAAPAASGAGAAALKHELGGGGGMVASCATLPGSGGNKSGLRALPGSVGGSGEGGHGLGAEAGAGAGQSDAAALPPQLANGVHENGGGPRAGSLQRLASGAYPEGMPSPSPQQQQQFTALADGSGSGGQGSAQQLAQPAVPLPLPPQQQRGGSGGSLRLSGSLEGRQGLLGSGSLPGGAGGHGSGSAELPSGSTAQMASGGDPANYPPIVAAAVQQLLLQQQHAAGGGSGAGLPPAPQHLAALLAAHGLTPSLGGLGTANGSFANGNGSGAFGGGPLGSSPYGAGGSGGPDTAPGSLLNGSLLNGNHLGLSPAGLRQQESRLQQQQQQLQQQQQQPQQQYQEEEGEGDEMEDDVNSDDDERLLLRPQPGAALKYGQGNRVLTYDDLAAQFGYGLKEAAGRLNICPTTLKRACRRLGIPRWPRRELAKHKRAKTGGRSEPNSQPPLQQQQAGQQQNGQNGSQAKGAGGGGGSGPSSNSGNPHRVAGGQQQQQQQRPNQAMPRPSSGSLLSGLQGMSGMGMDQLLPLSAAPTGSLPPEVIAALASTLQQQPQQQQGTSPLVGHVMQLLQHHQQMQQHQQHHMPPQHPHEQQQQQNGWHQPQQQQQQQQQYHANGHRMGGPPLPPGALLPPLQGGQLPQAPLLSNLGLPRRADSKLQSVGQGMGSLDILAAADFEMSVGNMSVGNSPRIALSNLGGLSQLGGLSAGFDFTGQGPGGTGPAATATGGGGATGPQNGPAFSTGAMPPRSQQQSQQQQQQQQQDPADK